MKNKTILVTGASRGIGRAIAWRLAQDGYDLVLHYRQQQAAALTLQDEIQQLGRQARLLSFDVGNRDQTRQALLEDIEPNGCYYGVVCNAGIARDNILPAMPPEDWDAVIHTNLDSFYNVLQPLTLPMIRRRNPGRIVTLSSLSGLTGNRGQVNYSAAKAGIIGASKALALELASRQITVNCVAPGLIDTEMVDENTRRAIIPHIPAGRMGTPAEVAAAVSFLISEEAAYITGQVLSINGGLAT